MKILLKDIKSARWAIMLIIAYFAILKDYIYTTCPSVLFTGYPCPGCGMTRAAFRILRFDFAGAWEMHPFVFAIIILALWWGVQRYIFQNTDMKVFWKAVVVVGIGMIIYYLWRMYTYFPGEAPMSFYNNNYFRRFLNIINNVIK